MKHYQSIGAMQKHEKIEALKDPKVNPYLVAVGGDTYGGLAAAYHKWTLLGANGSNLSSEQKQNIAKNFYQKLLTPLYQKSGLDPIPESEWMREAWNPDGALGYKIEDAYNSLHGVIHGFSGAIQDFANLGETATNLLGAGLKEGWAIVKNHDVPGGWLQSTMEAQNNKSGFFEQARKQTQDVPGLGTLSKALANVSHQAQFWNDSIPNQGLMSKASAFTVELGSELPLFKTLAIANETGIAATGLTDLLSKVKGGQLIAKSLLAGTEMTAYGAMTRPQEDKGAAVKDGIYGFAITALLSSLGKGGSVAAKTLLKNPKVASMGEKAATAMQRFKSGTREATAAEYDKEFKKDASNTIAVAGLNAQEAIDEQGIFLAHSWEDRELKPAEITAERQRMLDQDKAHNAPILSAATKVQKLTKGQVKATFFDPKRAAALRVSLKKLREDAASEIPETSEVAQVLSASDAAKRAKEPGAKASREKIKAQMASDPSMQAALKAGHVTQEQFEAAVDRAYGQRVAAAQRLAAANAARAKNSVRDAQEIGRKRTAISTKKSIPEVDSSKPRYGYGSKLFELDFDDPKDKAAYILSNANKSSAHDTIEKWYKGQPSPDNISLHGGKVRNAIKGLAKDANPEDGPLKIPSQRVERGPSSLETHSSYRYNLKGEPSYHLSISNAWKAFSKNAESGFRQAKASKAWDKDFESYLKEQVSDLGDKDFSDFLHNFLPPEIRDSGAFAETESKGENPNLMAFLYNYLPMLPKPIQEVLPDKLMESAKIALSMPKNNMMTEGQIQFYARVMYNHVDNLIGSERFSKGGERNIFRSTSPMMTGKTKWMDDSLTERLIKDESDLKKMFSGNPEHLETALKTFSSFVGPIVKAHRAQFRGVPDPKIPLEFKHQSEELANWLVSQSQRKESRLRLEKWNFDFERGGD